MQPTDKSNFVKLLNSCFELYDKPKVSGAVVQMWWSALERYAFDEVVAGFNRHCQDPDQGQFKPKPADIIRNIGGDSGTRAEAAWTKVDRAIRTVGPYQTVVFDDSLIHSAIEAMGGWIHLCNTPGDEYPFRHNEFIKRFRGLMMVPPRSAPQKLIGHTEHDFQVNGGNYKRGTKKAPQPVLIGNPNIAKQVYLEGRSEPQLDISRLSVSSQLKSLEKLYSEEETQEAVNE